MIAMFLIVFILCYLASNSESILARIMSSLLMSSLAMVLSFGIWGYDSKMSEDYQVPVDDIYSLSITTEVSGTFVLGCGSIDSNAYYTFYTKDSNNLYKMSKVGVDGTLIKLDSSQTPKLVKVVRMITEKPCTIFGGNESSREHDTGKRILVVPNNTIRQEYKVN